MVQIALESPLLPIFGHFGSLFCGNVQNYWCSLSILGHVFDPSRKKKRTMLKQNQICYIEVFPHSVNQVPWDLDTNSMGPSYYILKSYYHLSGVKHWQCPPILKHLSPEIPMDLTPQLGPVHNWLVDHSTQVYPTTAAISPHLLLSPPMFDKCSMISPSPVGSMHSWDARLIHVTPIF